MSAPTPVASDGFGPVGASAYKVPFLEAIKIRRSILTLSKESPISDDRIVMIVNHAIKHAPSPFHVQSCRVIVLFGDEHDKLWDIAMQRTKETMPPAVFATSESKIKGFQASYGTVLFFEDSSACEKLPPPLQGLLAKYPDCESSFLLLLISGYHADFE